MLKSKVNMFREDFHTLNLYIIADEAEAENEEQANSIGVLSLNSALSILFFHEFRACVLVHDLSKVISSQIL